MCIHSKLLHMFHFVEGAPAELPGSGMGGWEAKQSQQRNRLYTRSEDWWEKTFFLVIFRNLFVALEQTFFFFFSSRYHFFFLIVFYFMCFFFVWTYSGIYGTHYNTSILFPISTLTSMYAVKLTVTNHPFSIFRDSSLTQATGTNFYS